MKKEIKCGIHNYFDFVRRDAETGEVLGEYKAENIILNGFWPVFLSTSSRDVRKYIHFGSGITEPLVTDTKLTTWLGYKSSVNSGIDMSKFKSDGVIKVKRSCRLEDAEFVGSMISEVGFSNGTSGAAGLLTKALVKDMNGNVVTIEKKTGEILDIFATFYIKLPLPNDSDDIAIRRAYYAGGSYRTGKFIGYLIGSYNIMGDSYTKTYLTYTALPRKQAFTAASVDSGVQDQQPSYVIQDGGVTAAFDIPNKKITLSVNNLTSSVGNLKGGIKTIKLFGDLDMKVPNSIITQPVIVKEVLGTGDGVTQDFDPKFGWLRDNGTFQVYVNDLPVPSTPLYDEPLHMSPELNYITMVNVLDYSTYDDATGAALPPYPLGAAFEHSDNYGDITKIYTIFENPRYLTHAISSINAYRSIIYTSDDMITWTQALTISSNPAAVPGAHQNKRYWKCQPSNASYTFGIYSITCPQWDGKKLIHLESIPAIGDVITCTYQPDCIAKDNQHVLNNVKVTLSFNEYIPE